MYLVLLFMGALLLAAAVVLQLKPRTRSYDQEWFRKWQEGFDSELRKEGFVRNGNTWRLPKEAETNSPKEPSGSDSMKDRTSDKTLP